MDVAVVFQQAGLQAVFLLIFVFLVLIAVLLALIAVLLTIGIFRMGGRGPERPGVGEERPDAVAPRTGEVPPATRPGETPTREMPARPEGAPPDVARSEEPPPR
jgi:hypothetical protein